MILGAQAIFVGIENVQFDIPDNAKGYAWNSFTGFISSTDCCPVVGFHYPDLRSSAIWNALPLRQSA